MKKSYNRQQEAYMLAKANLQVLENREKEIEQKYIADHNIVNPDGSTPKGIYCIDDEKVFEKANAETAELPEAIENWQEILKARDLLKAAENNLINYGLSIIPSRNAHEKEVLTKAVANNYTTRLKVLDLVLKLDARTVRP